MSALANGAGSVGAAIDLVLPTLEAEPEPERVDLAATAAKSSELLDAIAVALHSQIALEQAGREYHEEMVRASRARETQMRRTLATIETQANAAERRERRQAKGKSRGHSARDNDWSPSEGKLAQVWGMLVPYAREHGHFTVNAAANSMPGVSNDVLRKAIPIYRERELVRMLAKKVKGGGRAWALMPGAEERGAELWRENT